MDAYSLSVVATTNRQPARVHGLEVTVAVQLWAVAGRQGCIVWLRAWRVCIRVVELPCELFERQLPLGLAKALFWDGEAWLTRALGLGWVCLGMQGTSPGSQGAGCNVALVM
jgi:hypothetical protein